MEQNQSLLWPYGARHAELDPELCAEELELASLSAALLPGLSSQEALAETWSLLTRDIPTLDRRAEIVEALIGDETLLQLMEECAAGFPLLDELWQTAQESGALASSLRTTAGLIGFVRGFEKVTGRSSGGVIESDVQRRDYYSGLFRSGWLGLRASRLYFDLLQKLTDHAGQAPEALSPLFSAAFKLMEQDRGNESRALLDELTRTYPEPASFSLDVSFSRDQRPAAISIAEIRTEPYRRDGVFQSKDWDGLSSMMRIPQLSSGESFRTLLLAELGSAQKSQLGKLRRELGKLTISGVDTLSAYGRELRFFTAAARFALRLKEAGMPVCRPAYRQDGPLAEIRGLYSPVAALYTGSQVPNDLHIGPGPDFSVLTGANGSGKTAFLMAAGQSVWLALLGGFLPARSAEIAPPDRICCLFAAGECETGEDSRMGLETERLARIGREATAASLVLLNDPLTSTSAAEAVELCAELICGFCKKGIRGLLVTHYSEIFDTAHKTLKEKGQSDALHSLAAASELVGGETRHSFRIEEAPPVRSGYAARMAARYGVTLPAMLDTLRRSGVTLADTEGREFHE